jgi:hypothetical protein
VLAILAAMLVIGGLVLAATAPAGPSANNKVDAYGGPAPVKPTNPKTKAACDKYYSATNQAAEARGCRAAAANYGAKKACAKKSGARRAACLKAAKSAFAKAKARVAKQARAEKACNDAKAKVVSAAQQELNALDPSAPDYDTKSAAIIAKISAATKTADACLKKAQK